MNDDEYGKRNKGIYYRILSVTQTNRVSDSHFVRIPSFIKDLFSKENRQKISFH